MLPYGLSKIQCSFLKSDLFNLHQVLNNYTKALRCCSHSAAWEKGVSKIKLVVEICLKLIEGNMDMFFFLSLFFGIIVALEPAQRFIMCFEYFPRCFVSLEECTAKHEIIYIHTKY